MVLLKFYKLQRPEDLTFSPLWATLLDFYTTFNKLYLHTSVCVIMVLSLSENTDEILVKLKNECVISFRLHNSLLFEPIDLIPFKGHSHWLLFYLVYEHWIRNPSLFMCWVDLVVQENRNRIKWRKGNVEEMEIIAGSQRSDTELRDRSFKPSVMSL